MLHEVGVMVGLWILEHVCLICVCVCAYCVCACVFQCVCECVCVSLTHERRGQDDGTRPMRDEASSSEHTEELRESSSRKPPPAFSGCVSHRGESAVSACAFHEEGWGGRRVGLMGNAHGEDTMRHGEVAGKGAGEWCWRRMVLMSVCAGPGGPPS